MIRFVDSNKSLSAKYGGGIFGSILVSGISMKDFVRNRNFMDLFRSLCYAVESLGIFAQFYATVYPAPLPTSKIRHVEAMFRYYKAVEVQSFYTQIFSVLFKHLRKFTGNEVYGIGYLAYMAFIFFKKRDVWIGLFFLILFIYFASIPLLVMDLISLF